MSNSPLLGRGHSGFLPTDIWKTLQAGSGYAPNFDNTAMSMKHQMDLYCRVKTVDISVSLSYVFTQTTNAYDSTTGSLIQTIQTVVTGAVSGSGSDIVGTFTDGTLTNAIAPRRRLTPLQKITFTPPTSTDAGNSVVTTSTYPPLVPSPTIVVTTTPYSATSAGLFSLFTRALVFQDSVSPLSYPTSHNAEAPTTMDRHRSNPNTYNSVSGNIATGAALTFNFPDGATYSFPFYVFGGPNTPPDETTSVTMTGAMTVTPHLWD